MPYSFSIPKMRRPPGVFTRAARPARGAGSAGWWWRRAPSASSAPSSAGGASRVGSSLLSRRSSSWPVMRRKVRRGRLRSSTATSSWVGASSRVGPPAGSAPSRLDGQRERLGQVHALAPLLLQAGLDLLRSPAHGDEAVLVGDRAVVGEPVDLVGLGVAADLGDDDLDLVGLGLLGEHRAQGLGVGVGQAARGDVGAVVGVAAQVGVAHPGHPQVLELVVLADRGEGDPVVDLGDLVQRPAGVLADERDAVVVGEHDDRPAAGDALAREVGPVLHQLLGRDVERHPGGHRAPPGLSTREAMMASTTGAISSSGTNRAPSSSTTPIVGQIRRPTSGPPVAESSSAAS